MTQTELGGYMKDLLTELEEESSDKIKMSENLNGHGWNISIEINLIEKMKNNFNNKFPSISQNSVEILIERMNYLLNSDINIEIISGKICSISINTALDECNTFHRWDKIKACLNSEKHITKINLSIGKLQRKIKKFESFK
jgi:hypothetical protein